jgi:hypothetical protein
VVAILVEEDEEPIHVVDAAAVAGDEIEALREATGLPQDVCPVK